LEDYESNMTRFSFDESKKTTTRFYVHIIYSVAFIENLAVKNHAEHK